LNNYRHLLKSYAFCGYALISGLLFAGIMVNVAISPFYYIQRLGVSSAVYGYFQMTLVLAYMVGTYVNRKAIHRWPSRFLLGIGLGCALLGGIVLCVLAAFTPNYPWLLTAGMAFYSFGSGIAFSNTSHQALEVFPQAGGASAALLSVFEMICVALLIWVGGLIYVDSFVPIALCVVGCVGLSLLFWVKLGRDAPLSNTPPLSPLSQKIR
jgi:DHA1 family bicyclomycin/chloramphenicol resistance-like MFS transporter